MKQALQGAGLVERGRKRGVHRKRRERRPLPGMLLHIDGSHHQWFQDERWYDLIVILDDATSEIYYAQLVEEESTATVMAGLREVIERKGCSARLYSDRGSHFWLTPKAGGKVDLPSPYAGGAGAAGVGSADDPGLLAAGAGTQRTQLLHLAGTVAAGVAAARDRERWRRPTGFCGSTTSPSSTAAFRSRRSAAGQRFCALPAEGPGTGFSRCSSSARVNRDNTVSFQNLSLQIERVRWRAYPGRLQGDRASASGWNPEPHARTALLGRYTAQGAALATTKMPARRAVEKTRGGKVIKPTFPPRLEIPQTPRDSHFPTASTATG